MCRRGRSIEERRTARVVCAGSPETAEAAEYASKTNPRTAPTTFALLFRFAHPTDYGTIESSEPREGGHLDMGPNAFA